MLPSVAGRLHAQGLDSPRFTDAVDVVRHLGAVQAQLHDMALWAVARRAENLTKSDLDASFARGDFLRTHVLRPTWHFVDPTDIHWLLELTAPRISKVISSTLKGVGLTTQQLERGSAVICQALAGGAALTRSELGVAIEESAVAGPDHLAHLAMYAEINALIVNGPMRGKQHTYVLLDSIAKAPPSRPRDELLGLMARRYARGHGPVRDKDLAWWASFTLSESRRAIELGELQPREIDGETYWSHGELIESGPAAAMLLSNFDEYISYARQPDDYALFDGTPDQMMRCTGLLAIEGRLAGTWTRTVKSRTVDIVVRSSPRVTPAIRRAIEAEAAAFGRFVERTPQLQITG